MAEHAHHHHDHDHQNVTPEALLKHMAEHNHAHLHELEDLSASLTGDAKIKLDEAIALLEEGNQKLAEAVTLL